MDSSYPLAGFRFEVRFAGMDEGDGSFSEASGLDREIKVAEIVEGGENRFVHRVPTQSSSGNLSLKRGIFRRKTALFSWCKTTLESGLALKIETKVLSLSLKDERDAPVLTWTFANCWPVKMQTSPFNAANGEVAIETIEFSYSCMTRSYSSG